MSYFGILNENGSSGKRFRSVFHIIKVNPHDIKKQRCIIVLLFLFYSTTFVFFFQCTLIINYEYIYVSTTRARAIGGWGGQRVDLPFIVDRSIPIVEYADITGTTTRYTVRM